MQFRITHLLMLVTVVSAVMAIQNFEVFRQIATVALALFSAWVVLRFKASSQQRVRWVLGAVAGLSAAFAWYLILLLTWPQFFNVRLMGLLDVSPGFVYWREASFFLVFCPLVGAAVSGWAVIASSPDLTGKFRVPSIFSQSVLAAAVLFRLLTLTGVSTPDWQSLSLFAVLVFVVHALNWLPRLIRSTEGNDGLSHAEQPA